MKIIGEVNTAKRFLGSKHRAMGMATALLLGLPVVQSQALAQSSPPIVKQPPTRPPSVEDINAAAAFCRAQAGITSTEQRLPLSPERYRVYTDCVLRILKDGVPT